GVGKQSLLLRLVGQVADGHEPKSIKPLRDRHALPRRLLAEAGVEPSVGSKGDSYDNALAETINGLYKAELIHRRAPWKTKESLELATLEWVSWFNHHRLLEPIGYIPPAEAEANYYRHLAEQAAIPA
ncbi:integrase core domain-containing protein, partial [Variovorax sp. RB2P76]|uniref:integrase core domain-containing protein n=1 Tax=Variovorax sp. RB2P76 TaxID=3443736 RepID=UPI003F46F83C